MNTIKNYIGIIFLMIILAIAFGGVVVLALAIVSALIVPMTYLWGMITNQSYDRVCDNSEIVYRLNQWGKLNILTKTRPVLVDQEQCTTTQPLACIILLIFTQGHPLIPPLVHGLLGLAQPI